MNIETLRRICENEETVPVRVSGVDLETDEQVVLVGSADPLFGLCAIVATEQQAADRSDSLGIVWCDPSPLVLDEPGALMRYKRKVGDLSNIELVQEQAAA